MLEHFAAWVMGRLGASNPFPVPFPHHSKNPKDLDLRSDSPGSRTLSPHRVYSHHVVQPTRATLYPITVISSSPGVVRHEAGIETSEISD